MGLFNKGKNTNNKATVSDENASMLPDNKQSRSDVITHKTNVLLALIAISMVVVFAVIAIMKANKNSSEFSSIEKQITVSDEKKKLSDVPYMKPIVTVEPETLKIENQTIGDEAFKQILVSVFNNPIKITDISASLQVENFNVEAQDCLSREKVFANSSCTINISWNPSARENKSLFIIIKYQELNENEVAGENSAKVNVSLQSVEPVVASDSSSAGEDEFFDEEEPVEDEEYSFDEDIAPVSNKREPAPVKKTVMPDNCKKYASKAYDFSGTFIGWVQGNKDVFSPNCSAIIGTMEDDGMVIATGTGKVIGKGAVLDKKKSEERRIELTLPLLDEVIQNVSAPAEPDFEEIMSNRKIVKSYGYNERRTTIGDNEDIYRLQDKLGIYADQIKNKIPFSIVDESQVSSLPKDERYVLRQSKPIPAVLNRPVYMSSETGGSQDITATVERNVFGGDGRTIIVPSGSQLIGVATYPTPGGIQAVQKINISWNRLIRPDGAEFDLGSVTNYSADAQGRAGVPGKNDTEYMQQLFVKPLLYSALPVAMEAIFPSSSKLVTRVKRSDGTYNTIDEATNIIDDGGDESDYGYAWNESQIFANMSSKDKMKAEVQQNFKSVMQKLIEDSSKQQIPFTVPSGTRIQVFLNKDIMLRIDDGIKDYLAEGEKEPANKYNLSAESSQGVDYNFKLGEGASPRGATTMKNFKTRTDKVHGVNIDPVEEETTDEEEETYEDEGEEEEEEYEE